MILAAMVDAGAKLAPPPLLLPALLPLPLPPPMLLVTALPLILAGVGVPLLVADWAAVVGRLV
jgi:hypothetical protein